MHAFTLASCCFLFVANASAQLVIGIDDLDPTTGTAHTYPWGQAAGHTSLHVYSVQTLRALGVCTGSVLLDLAIAPGTSGTGVFNAPQALIQIGHLSVSPPVPGAWTTHLASPITVHDVTSGPYTFSWTLNTHVSLPGFAAAGFVWDGTRDIGLLVSNAPGTTGTFSARRSGTQRRHIVGVFQATTQTPSANDLAATEVKMTWAPNNCATRTKFGAGCYDRALTFYENFTNLQTFDLAGAPANETVVHALQSTSPVGFTVLQAGTPAWSAPTGSPVLSNAAVPAQMTDDSISQPLALPFTFPFPGGSTNVIHAAANGYVMLAATTSNAADITPTPAELVAQPPRLCPLWCDIHPTLNLTTNPASGIYFHVDPSNTTAYVTWFDCADGRGTHPAAGVTSVNVQCVLHSNGNFEFRYGTILPSSNAGLVIAGWSPGNIGGSACRDGGSINLSASFPFTAFGPDNAALALDSTFPSLGASFDLTTSNVPNVLPLAILLFGDAPVVPALDLFFIGAPGCFLHTTANITSLTVPGAGTTAVASVAIPASPPLIGTTMTSQSVAFSLDNALNMVTSNGLVWTIGN